MTRGLPSITKIARQAAWLWRVLAVVVVWPMPNLAAPPEVIRFNEHIRPILSDRCFACHGPDAKRREADLRLDSFEEATRDLGGRAAIVPGNAEASELLRRVTSADPDERMPPSSTKKPPLTSAEVALLRRWIEEGAVYEGHWSLLPLRTDPPPTPHMTGWARNPIDLFILSRLEAHGLRPSEEAPREVLVRRLYLDVTGLLPTPEEVAAFVSDPDPNAYEALVERVLSSPHYGERWGRHWLDQARYADSNGYSIDGDRDMWPYRDWVLRALNDDMPFDQFTREQLAGDLLPNATKRQIAATAFHRNTLINQEGGVDREQFRTESVVDRVNTTGAVWLGLTIGCAQCHTHKFDPIQQQEYYRLFAFFNSTRDANDRGPTLPIRECELLLRDGTPDPHAATERLREEVAQRRSAWETAERTRLEEALADNDTAPVEWRPVEYVSHTADSGAPLTLLEDHSLLAGPDVQPLDAYRIVFTSPVKTVAAVRLRVLTHPSLPKQGPGRAGNGNFVLTEFSLRCGTDAVALAGTFADHEQPGFPISAAVDADSKTGWAINVGPQSTAKMNADHEAVFVLAAPLHTDGRALEVRLEHGLNAHYLVGRFAIEVSDRAPPLPRPRQQALLAALRVPPAKRTPAQQQLVADTFAQIDPPAQQLRSLPKPVTGQLMVMRESDTPRTTYLLTRGDFTRPDKDLGPLSPGVPSAIPPALDATSRPLNRLDLANWLVDPRQPLTPRVTMNRIWMRYFGRGLVETEEDFGAQGSPPSHPDLLDWLAAEFIRQGWSMKAMHRLIVTSATYRQSSNLRPDLQEKDPRNILLARQSRVRVEAEVVRDMALCASGLLQNRLGGPSVRPPQPEGVYAFTQTSKSWNEERGANRYRRALYTQFYRSAPYPLLTTFDAPDFQTVCTRRNRSNTPLQALTVANDPALLEMAQALAARVLRECPGDGDEAVACRLRYAVTLCLCRPETDDERRILREYLQRQQSELLDDTESARALWGGPDLPREQLAEAAAWVCVARALLNTDNFITRE